MKYILGCDTSCDDTSIGIIEFDEKTYEYKILSNIKYSQVKECVKYGGVVPEISARSHLSQIVNIFALALKTANIKQEQIDFFSCTVGPGLIGGVIVGSSFIKTLAKLNNKPFIPIHHLEGHIASVNYEPPFLILVISGGHSLVASCDTDYNFKILCETLDDSAGEVFDKIGREMNLPFPSGSHIENLAKTSQQNIPPLLINKSKLSFSFSGLKTKCLHLLQDNKQEDVANFLQKSVAKHLIDKIHKCIEITQINKIIVCGGVSANKFIKQEMLNVFDVFFPPLELCMDNGVMICLAALKRIKSNKKINIYINEFSRKPLDQWSDFLND